MPLQGWPFYWRYGAAGPAPAVIRHRKARRHRIRLTSPRASSPTRLPWQLLPQSYKDKGELTVAMDLHYPPTTFLADDNITPIGLNPDMARLIAKKLGLKLKFENTTFDTIIPGLDGGRYDFTATTMSKTESG